MSAVPASDPAVTAKGYFIYKVQSSASVTGSVLLKNPGTEAITVELAAVDAITAQTGGSAFETGDVKTRATGAWLKFAASSVTLAVGTQQVVDFSVNVPASTRPGQYLAGISAYAPNIPATAVVNQGGSKMDANVTVQTRYVIAVQVDVEGAWTPSMKIDSVALVQQPSGPFIGVRMKNDGDTLFKSSGTFVLADAGGKRILEQPIHLGTFVPGTEILYPVKWSGELAQGTYKVEVAVDYGANKQATYTSELEIGTDKAVQNSAVAPQQPGTISGAGNNGNVAGPSNVQASATAQSQEGSSMWALALGGLSVLLLAVAALLARRRRSQAPVKVL
ncbi:MAG: DUF916 domain-containing protein [Chloroflexota bacterium]|nr:DUF916 domain-containing protein [Chloroflexota bacterium]MDQ5866802.1 DUF916 domain-containing protein [Chloroflexota bacterium]